MGKGCANGCILKACGLLAVGAFLVCALAAVGQQAYARVYAYTAPIPAAESAGIITGMNVVAAFGLVGVLVLGAVVLVRRVD